MKTKSISVSSAFCLLILLASPLFADSLTLDAAIKETSAYFIKQIPAKAKVALIPFDTPTGRLSDYVFEELWKRFEDSRNFVMIDRKNIDRIDTEIKIQYESGRVDDANMVSITKQYGAEFLIYGQITTLGKEYRITNMRRSKKR